MLELYKLWLRIGYLFSARVLDLHMYRDSTAFLS